MTCRFYDEHVITWLGQAGYVSNRIWPDGARYTRCYATIAAAFADPDRID